MSYNYNKIGWENSPSTKTPLNANNLNKMDEAIYSLHTQKQEKLVAGEGIDLNPDTNEIKVIGGGGGDCKFKILTIDAPLNEAGILNVLKNNEGFECSGFFYNTDISSYCEFEGLYVGKTVSGEIIHYGYCHIRGLHQSDYEVDYRIDDEDGDTWYKSYPNAETITFDSDKMESNNVKDAIEEAYEHGGGSGSDVVELTKAEYDALPDTKLTDGKQYFIKDYSESGSGSDNVYSDEEIEIGTWFGKPLYRKVVSRENLALPSYSASSIDVNLTSDIGTSNIQIIKANITVNDSASGQWASVGCQIAHTSGTNSYKVKCLDSWGGASGRYVYFILEYTKD